MSLEKDNSSKKGNVKEIIDVLRKIDQGQKQMGSEDRCVDSASSRQNLKGKEVTWVAKTNAMHEAGLFTSRKQSYMAPQFSRNRREKKKFWQCQTTSENILRKP